MRKFFKDIDEGTWMHFIIIVIGVIALMLLIKLR